jgi:glycosyltransferase involved in cell wall biosynthesis
VRILIVQPSLDPPGGGNLVAAWMLQALRDEHELSLLVGKAPDLAACNRHYGTSLRPRDFELRCLPALGRWAARLAPTPMSMLKDARLMRRSFALAARHDLVMACNNEVDFGRRGIQYVHYAKTGMTRPPVDLRSCRPLEALVEVYYRVARRVADFSTARMKANLTLVNSEYIGAQVRAVHGIDPVVLHPPVAGRFSAVPWTERENAFVCIGRLSPEKHLDWIVDILRRVRAGGDDVGLHIVGVPDDRRHTRLVRRLAHEHADWIRLHLDIPRADLLRLVGRQRYGIHAMPDEHFGIAVAEMVRAGCIVFVPDGGGPAEIVGDQAELRWSTPDDAVAKIRAVVRDPLRQSALRVQLAARAALFSTERFCSELRALVRDFDLARQDDSDRAWRGSLCVDVTARAQASPGHVTVDRNVPTSVRSGPTGSTNV